jgi:hypothetical protein
MKGAATGEVEIGVTSVSEMNEPGIDIVGPLPQEISTPTTLTGFPRPRLPLLTRRNTCSLRYKKEMSLQTLP